MKKVFGVVLIVGAVLVGLQAGGYHVVDGARVLMGYQVTPKGKFSEPFEVTISSFLSGDGERVKLAVVQSAFHYTDSKGVKWHVPADEFSDGASIPKMIQTAVGDPFSGYYFRAAVVHDRYCVTKERPWEDVHLMFYEASLTEGTPLSLAKKMYAGIILGGPRWEPRKQSQFRGLFSTSAYADDTAVTSEQCVKLIDSVKDKSKKDQFAALTTWIEQEKPPIKEIQDCVAALRKAHEAPTSQ